MTSRFLKCHAIGRLAHIHTSCASSLRLSTRHCASFWSQRTHPVTPSSHSRRLTTAGSSVRLPGLLEEETLPNYDPEEFYPVHIGDKINSRYQVIGKLGYGATSTVWFCRDPQDGEYVAVKVYVRTPARRIIRERTTYEHLATLETAHPGYFHIRPTIDMFELVRRSGDVHFCLVHPPLQSTLFAFQRLSGKPRPLPEDLAKDIMKASLQALDFLHTEANVTHCDVKLSNIMLGIEDKDVLVDYEKAEQLTPSDRKVINEERTIYASRSFHHPRSHAFGLPVLCDFGEARRGTTHPWAEIQPEVYKSPEILMQFDEWGHPVDIWNSACVLWDMLEVEHLFDGYDDEGFHNNRCHMHEMVCLLGSPPQEFLRRSPHTHRLFDENGAWKAVPPITKTSLDSRENYLEGESKVQCLDFLKSMLRWLPEERMTARELLQHPWLHGI